MRAPHSIPPGQPSPGLFISKIYFGYFLSGHDMWPVDEKKKVKENQSMKQDSHLLQQRELLKRNTLGKSHSGHLITV
jgi:hypothetical protein